MKELTLRCKKCEAVRVFYAQTTEKIIELIDETKWRDLPGGEALCPNCDKKYREE